MDLRRTCVIARLLVSLCLGSVAAAHAQTDRGTITGVVTDSSGGLLQGASVKAVHVATNFERTVTTSDQGHYTIPQLPVGAYIIVITMKGFQTTTLEHIEVTAGSIVRVDESLKVGDLQDAVTVT